MNPSAGLVTALNKMREMSVESGDVYHQFFPVVDSNTKIGEWGAPIFGSNYQAVQESFFGLLKQIAYVATVTRLYDNPLSQLEGENIPLGWAGEETYINPIKGRAFDVNDFAGILSISVNRSNNIITFTLERFIILKAHSVTPTIYSTFDVFSIPYSTVVRNTINMI